jgi:pyruvate-ferredoxin/flavodoxin oxidoreductase
MAGLLKGLNRRRPALFNIYTPCPVEHGLPDDWAQHAARLALESRAFPYLTFDPDAGESWADCMSLDGNPSVEDEWPTYTLEYIDDAGAQQSMELPLTTADWAATEGRFRKHFKPLKAGTESGELVPFHEYLTLSHSDREGRTPFIYVLDAAKRLAKWTVAMEIVTLAEERQLHWSQLRELAGVVVAEATRARVVESLESEVEARIAAVRAEYEAKLHEVQISMPAVIARRLAEGLLRKVSQPDGQQMDARLFAGVQPVRAPETTPFSATTVTPHSNGTPSPAIASVTATAPAVAIAEPVSTPAADASDALTIEAWIDSERCTTCNECTNANRKMFAYNGDKQAYIKDAAAGTFAQLVQAAEKCPVAAIHPGTPLNPKEKDLEKWLKRAQAF